MRVALDCRTVTAAKTGDRTYALNLSRTLAADAGDLDLLLYTSEPTHLTEHQQQGVTPVVLRSVPAWSFTPIHFPLDLARRRVDLAHVQYIIPPSAPCPVVTTIHDIAFRRFPELFPLKHRLLLNWLIPMATRWAAAVITCSESTRRDLIELMNVPEEKIVVTPYGVDPIYRPLPREEAAVQARTLLGVPIPYVLAVGLLQPRKNLPRLVRAWGRIAGRVPHTLVIAGKRGWDNEALDLAVAALPAGARPHLTGYVADADLPLLYAGADLFAYPSLYEGFGFPPLEAMACGTPVLTSNVSSLPEVAGDAALLVDPASERSIADGVFSLLSDPERRARMSEAGLRQAAGFTWRRTAEQTVEVYERVLSGDLRPL